jgi:hypothetical protein
MTGLSDKQKEKIQKKIAEELEFADYAHDVHRNYAAEVAAEGDIDWARELFSKALETVSEHYDPLDAKRMIQETMYESIQDADWALKLGGEILGDPNVSDQDKLAQAEFMINELDKVQEGKAIMDQLAETSTDEVCSDPWEIFDAAHTANDTLEDNDLVNWLCDKSLEAAKGTDDEEGMTDSVADLRSNL